MHVVRDVEQFALLNEPEVRRFLTYKTKIYDEAVIQEYIQEFYVRLIESRSLEQFDTTLLEHGTEENLYDQYICSRLCWLLPLMARKNLWNKLAQPSEKVWDEESNRYVRPRKPVQIISVVTNPHVKSHSEPLDVWDFVSEKSGPFKIKPSYKTSVDHSEADDEVRRMVEEFKVYIRKTETEKSAGRMTLYLDYKMKGCRSVDIAQVMDVSGNMIKLVKQKVRKKYDEWQNA